MTHNGKQLKLIKNKKKFYGSSYQKCYSSKRKRCKLLSESEIFAESDNFFFLLNM